MRTAGGLLLGAIIMVGIMAGTPAALAQSDSDAAEAEGLVKVKVTGLQTVFAHPDADLSRYNKVMLDPIEVAFSKSWERQQRDYRDITAAEKAPLPSAIATLSIDNANSGGMDGLAPHTMRPSFTSNRQARKS